MITFDNWTIKAGGLIARQYDNLSRRIDIEGDIPAGWTWALLTQCGDQLNIITLTEADGGLYAVLTAEMLSVAGYYRLQLRGTQGEVVRHTNAITAHIPASLSGDVQWPTVPSEFTQVEQRIQTLNSNPPYPGDDGYWMIYDIDSGAYIQSSLPLPPVAEGPPGPAGAAATVTVGTTATGDPGTEANVQNTGTENAAILNFTIPAGRDGPPGVTPNISATASDLPAGSNPTVEVSGSPESPVIAFGIPAGQPGKNGTPGANGAPGVDGQTPNISIGSVKTLPAESPATAEITGQTPNLTLNLGLPRGPAGIEWQLIQEQTLSEDVDVVSFDFSDAPLKSCRVICVPGVQVSGWKNIEVNSGGTIATINGISSAGGVIIWTVEFGQSVIIRAEIGSAKIANGVNGGSVAVGVFDADDPSFSGKTNITSFSVKNADICVTGAYFQVLGVLE